MNAQKNHVKDLADIFQETGHYDGLKCIESIEKYMPESYFFSTVQGAYFFNTCKYLWRKDRKGKPRKDIQKANFYFQRFVEQGGDTERFLRALRRVLKERDENFPKLTDDFDRFSISELKKRL